MDMTTTLDQLGVTLHAYAGADCLVQSPVDGAPMAALRSHTRAEVEASITHAVEAFRVWRGVRDVVMELCCALHNFWVRLTPWQPMI